MKKLLALLVLFLLVGCTQTVVPVEIINGEKIEGGHHNEV